MGNVDYFFGFLFLFSSTIHASIQEDMDVLFPKAITEDMKYISVDDRGFIAGQLGNQCFRIAAGVSLALDNECFFAIPSLVKDMYPEIFHRIPLIKPYKDVEYKICCRGHFKDLPLINGSTRVLDYPFSARYFVHHSDVVRELFKPKQEIEKKLQEKYRYILENQNKYVGIHVRTFVTKKDGYLLPNHKEFFPMWAVSPFYISKAMKYFDRDVTFVVFTDNPRVAKEMLEIFDRKFIFSDGSLEEDFYTISMMDNMIVGNSTFSIFAAFLNPNPDQVVIKPRRSRVFDIHLPHWISIRNDNNRTRIPREYDKWYNICLKHAAKNGYLTKMD